MTDNKKMEQVWSELNYNLRITKYVTCVTKELPLKASVAYGKQVIKSNFEEGSEEYETLMGRLGNLIKEFEECIAEPEKV